MSKRCLPQRSTRGQLPLFLRDSPHTPKREKPIALEDPQEVQRRNLEIKRKNQQLLNFIKYPFHRAVHYFFDLNIFPRCEGHISYAIDENNALKNSFSNDKNQLNKCSYGQVLNRQLFGLPIDEMFIYNQKKQSKNKNLCHVYLWQTQDKKYQCDRIITTLSVIAKKMKKGISLQQLKSFSVLNKDEQLQIIFDQNFHIDERIQVLNQRINTLKNRKQINKPGWQADDNAYFYQSLNQKLHNQITQLKKNLLAENVIKKLQSTSLTNEPLSRKSYYQKTLYYYYHQVEAIQAVFLSNQSDPVNLFLFENAQQTIKIAAQLVAKKSQFVGQVHFYQAKSMVKKLFNFDLTFKSQRHQAFPQYQKNFRKKCDQIKRWHQKYRLITNEVLFPSLNKYKINQKLALGTKTQISGKQYLMMLVFYWICRALNELKPILTQFPQLISYISSDFFPKVYTSLVEATSSALVAMMHLAIETLPDLLSKPDPLALMPLKLYIEYQDSLGVALISKEGIQSEGPIQTAFSREESKSQLTNKRFKGDNI